MELLHTDLQRTMEDWNSHYVRAKRREGQIPGIPDKLFFLPEESGTRCYGFEYVEEELLQIETELENDEGQPDWVQPDFITAVNRLIPDCTPPTSFAEAEELYVTIIGRINALENL